MKQVNTNEILIQTDLQAEDLLISKKRKNYEPVTVCGRFNDINLSSWMKSMDMIDLIVDMSKPTQRFFRLLKCNRDGDTNICNIRNENIITQVESKAYVELNKKGVAIRLRKKVYMINPKLIYPYPDGRERAESLWNSMGGSD